MDHETSINATAWDTMSTTELIQQQEIISTRISALYSLPHTPQIVSMIQSLQQAQQYLYDKING